ncbi:hypothetical protein DICSQDRAFT_165402 [Dichomitus squalens LYAD-421 SS1]|uniref:uncharacterized protein n=1 Tax=Dichomitus squalens (strain LYAD-421) TaxID=732165 RepID=UPI0004410F28|nr:uncharacterized protein DICSQDRAFT_165402 [Dichomitus squalens LYAD-421 SS1]EJF65691.1 hypothetical protein DICSQDRAFT_165402 [Dichomitus squalens LYAD-421 SS1]
MSDHHKPSSNQPVTLARPITLTSVFHLLLGIVIPSFIPLCGHRLLASGLVCIRDIYLLIDVVCPHDAYPPADYTLTYLASAIGLVIFTIIRISIGLSRIPMPIWYVSKVVAAPVGCVTMRLLAVAEPDLGIVAGPSLLDPTRMLVGHPDDAIPGYARYGHFFRKTVSPSEEKKPTDTRRLGLKCLICASTLSFLSSSCIATFVACSTTIAHWILGVYSPPWLDPSGQFESVSLRTTFVATVVSAWLIDVPGVLVVDLLPLALAGDYKSAAVVFKEHVSEIKRWWAQITSRTSSRVIRLLHLRFGRFLTAGPPGIWLGEKNANDGGLDFRHASIASVVACGLYVATVWVDDWMMYRWKGHTNSVTHEDDQEAEEVEKGHEQILAQA